MGNTLQSTAYFVNATALGVPVVEAVAPVYDVQEVMEETHGFSNTLIIYVGIGVLVVAGIAILLIAKAKKRS